MPTAPTGLICAAICLWSSLLTGCTGLGPRTVAQDRFDYATVLATSWKQQMLGNIVKLRYGDTPVFLDVASVISQYSIETQVDLRLTWVDPNPVSDDSQSAGATARYIDRPTITYSPLAGERFARSLMRPIPPPAIVSLAQAGYPIDTVLRTCVQGVNGIQNRYGGAARATLADAEFYPLLERLRRVQKSGALGLRLQKTGETEGLVMTFAGEMTEDVEQDIAAIRQTLGLAPEAGEFRIVYGAIAADDREIAILTRSVLEILVDLASYIDVPAEHVAAQRVSPPLPQERVGDAAIPPLMRIHSSRQRPDDSFVAIPYRGYWFYIEDTDLRTKTLFTFLMFVFSLTETEGSSGAPVVTIPAG